MPPTRGGPMNPGKEGLKKLSFCNTMLICVVCVVSALILF